MCQCYSRAVPVETRIPGRISFEENESPPRPTNITVHSPFSRCTNVHSFTMAEVWNVCDHAAHYYSHVS